MKPIVLFDAAPFCYGPISTLQVVVDQLLDADAELVMLVSGTSAEFMRGYDARCHQVECDTEVRSDLERVDDLFRRCSLFVSNTNPISAAFAVSLGCKVVYLDTLFWMWDEIDPLLHDVELYVAQTFTGIEENRLRVGSHIRNFREVGPLTPVKMPCLDIRDHCVIGFGGMESKLTVPGVTNNYPWVMTRLLIDIFGHIEPFGRYLFRGGARVMDALAREFPDSRFEFAFSTHAQYIDELSAARNALLSPGLTGAYEAMQAAVPTCLLLPQNYSQQLQASIFLRGEDPSFAGWEWTHIYPQLNLPRYMPEAEAVARLNEQIRRFESDVVAQQKYRDQLVRTLPVKRSAAPAARASGSPEVARMIRELVS